MQHIENIDIFAIASFLACATMEVEIDECIVRANAGIRHTHPQGACKPPNEAPGHSLKGLQPEDRGPKGARPGRGKRPGEPADWRKAVRTMFFCLGRGMGPVALQVFKT